MIVNLKKIGIADRQSIVQDGGTAIALVSLNMYI
jgi:hypothetical protein